MVTRGESKSGAKHSYGDGSGQGNYTERKIIDLSKDNFLEGIIGSATKSERYKIIQIGDDIFPIYLNITEEPFPESRRFSRPHQSGTNSSISSISNLYDYVKRYDIDFTPAPEVNPALLNENKTPKAVYHGTDEEFTVFDITKSRSYYEAPDYDLPGFYFSESVEESSSYGNLGQYYIRISNPYDGTVEEYYDESKRGV